MMQLTTDQRIYFSQNKVNILNIKWLRLFLYTLYMIYQLKAQYENMKAYPGDIII